MASNIAAALFLFGSILFTIDGIVYLLEEINSHAILYTFASLSFVVGSALMLDFEVKGTKPDAR
jgi:hypothetical protein